MSYYADDWLTVHLGDCRAVMAGLEPESVHCVVTSPPYWGLRDYGTDGQLGLEPTPEAYVESMVAVFREVRRVLRSDGTVWLNLGDSYAAGGGSGTQRLDELGERLGTGGGKKHSSRPSGRAPSAGLAQKQLVGIPWRVAFALQADGWYLRSDIIWSKPNPMPESVTDRPTKAHEYLFLLSKSPRYWYDADAVREPNTPGTLARHGGPPETPHYAAYSDGVHGHRPHEGRINQNGGETNGRNLRSVWTVATQPYPGAHFATFPPKLIEPCIKAGCPDKVCQECGSPWERVVERTPTTSQQKSWANGEHVQVSKGLSRPGRFVDGHAETVGWRSTCQCGDPANRASRPSGVAKAAAGSPPVPGTVLDPFAGSGTTAMVANRLSRRAVLIDLNADYLGQVMDRNRELPLGLVG